MSERANLYFEKALTAIRGRDNETALRLLVEAIKLKPNFVEAWVVRGNVLHSTERHFDSLLHYDRALSINEKLHDAWNNRGLAFADLGMWGEAELSFRRSAELLPALEPHMGLANMFCTTMRLEDAAKEYRAAIDADSGNFEAHFNLGVTLLGLGRWEEGFREYEWRWQNTPYPPAAYRNDQKWKGEDLAGKRIVLYPEQGYGDEIMGLRFANELAQRFPEATILVQARAPMYRLACNSFGGNIAVVDMHADDGGLGGIPIDYSCPLLDVPGVLGLYRDTVPRPRRYLNAAVGATREWKSRLLKLPPGLNVGLCWSSGGHLNTARAAQQAKSVPLAWLRPLAMPGVNLISLQKPREPVGDFPLTEWTDDIHDFAGTAGLIEALDLVISVDTSVAHLAGAIGKPVANLVRFSGYWPWLAPDIAPKSGYSIWYPSMILLRQPRLADWLEPIRLATDLVAANAKARAA